MDAQNKKIDAFLSAIKDLALEECKKIDDETDMIRENRLKTLNKEARIRSKAYLEYEIARLRAALNSDLSKYEEEAKRELTTLRNSLMDKVFSTVFNNLTDFTKTAEYKELLLNSVREISSEFRGSDDVEIFIRQEDLLLQNEIKSVFGRECTISVSDKIKLGGISAVCNTTKMLADDTLDTRLENQKSWFLEQSGLSI